MIQIGNYDSPPFSWLGIYLDGALSLHWVWIFAAGLVLALLVVRAFYKMRERRRERIAGGPYKQELANEKKLNKVLQDSFAAEREALKRQVTETQGNMPILFAAVNEALGPSYPAKNIITAIEAVREFEDWGKRVTAELKNAAPYALPSEPANYFAGSDRREGFRAFLLRQTRASVQDGEAKIKQLEAALDSRSGEVDLLREEVTRLNAILTTQKITISRLENAVPTLNPDQLAAVNRVSKA